MHNRSFLTGCLVLVLAVAASAATRPKGQVERVQPSNFITLQAGHMLQSFTAAEACTAASIDEIVYRMDGWVIENELYKALIDPVVGQRQNDTISSIGLGARWQWRKQLSLAIDYGLPLAGADGEASDRGNSKWHLDLTYRY